jgi:hypothetical protein
MLNTNFSFFSRLYDKFFSIFRLMEDLGNQVSSKAKDLDDWIEQLYDCKQLQENQVKGTGHDRG